VTALHHVLLGNGPAAIAAAEAIRGRDAACRITLVSAEPVPFYSPCPLAEYVEASVPRERLFLRAESFYRDLAIDARLGLPATAIDTAAREVILGGEERLRYDRLLIATGAQALIPPIPGLADTRGVFALKTLADADGILARLPAARRALVLGAGFIGLEAAQALVRRGLSVTVVEQRDQVLPQMLDAEMAALVARRLAEHGVDVRTGVALQAVIGGAQGVTGARVQGAEIPCELVVCAAGVRPDLGWLAGSGIAHPDARPRAGVDAAEGILVDDRMATSAPEVFAAGDVVAFADTLGARRMLPNWPNAVRTGAVAGTCMAGGDRRCRGLDAVNVVRIFDVPVSSFGSREGDRTLTRRDGDRMRRLTLRDHRIVGGQLYGDVDRAGLYYELMNKRVDVERLEDELLSPGFGIGRMLPRPPRWAA
jgi:NADPH-dependent 2,4-dienoyl-CoA reductase/sulfur reductase-like enzyme